MTARAAVNPQAFPLEREPDRRVQAAQAPGGPGDAGGAGATAAGPHGGGTITTGPDGGSATLAGPHGGPVDRRARTERRVTYDRRQFIRFEDDRRSGVDRRAGNESWEIS